MIDYIDWAVYTFHITSESVIGNQAPFYFDNSTLDIYLMYSTGATLNIIPESCFAFPAKLVDYLNENKITFVFWVPFVLVNVANMNILASKKPEYLKDVFFAGELCPTSTSTTGDNICQIVVMPTCMARQRLLLTALIMWSNVYFLMMSHYPSVSRARIVMF